MRLPQANDRQRAIAGLTSGRTSDRTSGRTAGRTTGGSAGRGAGIETGVSVASYPLGGVVAYGLIGWLIAWLIHASWPIPAGMIFGLAIGTGYVIYRYGTKAGSAHTNTNPRKE